ncbi:MAG: HAD hydrolase-like protein [Candidatus Jorgensenbacteria bacterium]|nr:HAD hydrolase-like protein [Candidatus Jorgensenbacteria bacterium]
MQDKRPWRLAAVDWDGPCATSLLVYYWSVRAAFRSVKMPAPSLAFFRDAVSANVERFYDLTGITEHLTMQEIDKIRDAYLKRHWSAIRPTHGIHGLMRACALRKIPFVIVSSNERLHIEQKLRAFRLRRFVADIIESHRKKEALERLAKRFRVPFGNILFVEDSSEPIVAANELGVSTVAFLGGFNSQTKLLAANPTFIAQHMNDVTGLIRQ